METLESLQINIRNIGITVQEGKELENDIKTNKKGIPFASNPEILY